MMRARVLRWLVIGFLAAGGVLCVALLSVYAFLQSEAGRSRIAEALNRSLGGDAGFRVRVGRIGGDLLRCVEIQDLSVLDDDGVWLRLRQASATWSPARLLLGSLRITSLDADGLVVMRRPAASESPEDSGWAGLPLDVSIDRFRLREVLLEPPLTGERFAFDAAGEISVDAGDELRMRLSVTRTEGTSGEFRLEAEIRPRSEPSRFELALDEASGGILARALDLEGLPAISIRASAEGPAHDLRGSALARAGDLARFDGHFGVDATAGPAVTLDGSAEIAGLVEPPLRDLLAGEVAFSVRAKWTGDGLAVQEGRFSHALARLELSGEVRGTAVEGEAVLAVADLAPLSGLADLPLHGGAELHALIRSDDVRRGVSAVTNATLREPLPGGSPWLALVGSRVDVGGSLEFEAGRQWTLRDLKVAAAGVNLVANGSLGTDGENLRADYQLTVPSLAALAEPVGSPLAGTLTASGEVGGDPADPALSVRLAAEDLSVGGIALGPAEGRVALEDVVSGASGEVELSARYAPVGVISLTSGVSPRAGGTLRLAPLVLTARDATLAGTLDLDPARGTATGQLAAERIALASWSEPAGRTLSGSAHLALALTGGAEQQLDVDAGGEALSIALDDGGALTVAAIEVSARIADLLGSPRGELRIDATDAAGEGVKLESVAATLAMSDPHSARATLRATGETNAPVALELAADYRSGDRGFTVTLAALDATVDEHVIRLLQPAEITREDGATGLSNLRLAVADGWVTAEGHLDAVQIAASIEADRLSLATLAALVPLVDATGSVSGQLTLGGTRDAPTGEVELTGSDVRWAHATPGSDAVVSSRLHGEWRAGRLELALALGEPSEAGIDARLSLPLRLDAQTLALSVPEQEPVGGRLRWSGDLEPVWDLVSPNEDRFSGPGDLAVDLTGSVAAPRISGHLQIDQGRYENVLSGTTLADVNLRLVGDGEKLVLEQLSASDGGKGTLSGRGVVQLLPGRSYPIDLSLEFDDMLLAARDELVLNASGRLVLEGTLTSARLSGKITTGRTELMLAGSLPPNVVELEFDEVVAGKPIARESDGPRGADTPSILALDVDISVPGRAFARGLGLDSEWSGDLKISGDAKAPKIAGALSPVRGHFTLLGKRFTLERGAIRFTGTDDFDPLLDLIAEHRASTLTALVNITGSASNPKVELTSRPPLPESEIASQALFGTGSSNLTPAQSLQLASALATYSGVGGVAGILDSTRRALGVDVINFAESEENPDATRVSVGKYITEGVYIEVEAGGEQGSRAATTVEVEVLPDVRIEGGTTEKGGNKVGVKWKWDY